MHTTASKVSKTNESSPNPMARPDKAEILQAIGKRSFATLATTSPAHRPHKTSGGVPIPPETARRLACEAKIIPIVLGGDRCALDVGRDRRHASRAQRRALRAMYRTCAFDGCDVVFDRCEIHHLVEWELGGMTDLANLLPLCSRHHHVVHEGGWGLSLATGRTLTIIQPDGVVFAACEPDVAETTGRRGRPSDTVRRRSLDQTEPLPLAS